MNETKWTPEKRERDLASLMVLLDRLQTYACAENLVWIFPDDFRPVFGLPIIYASVDKPMLAHRPA